jgi:transcriptional regulator with XRE-family HTH domain
MGRKTKTGFAILYSNILFLIKLNNFGVGEFEKAAGVSAGYISRSKKGDNASLDFVVRAAQIFGVSIDDLIMVDLRKQYIESKRLEVLSGDLSEESLKNWFLDLNNKGIIKIVGRKNSNRKS